MEHHRQVKSTADQNVEKRTTGREGGREGRGDRGGGVVVGWGHTYLKTPPEFFTLPKEISAKTNLYPYKLHKIVLHPSEILKNLESQEPWKFHDFLLITAATKFPHCF